MKFRIINKSDNRVISYGNPATAASYLYNMNYGNYMVIKSDLTGDRLVQYFMNYPATNSVAEITQRLLEA